MTILSEIADLTGRLNTRLHTIQTRANRRLTNMKTQADTELQIIRQKVTATDGFLRNQTANLTDRATNRVTRARKDVDAIRRRFPKL